MAITQQNQMIGQNLRSIKEFERANQPLKTESREVSHRHIMNAITRNHSEMELMKIKLNEILHDKMGEH